MRATAVLEEQHRRVAGLIEQLRSGWSDPSELLIQLADDLAAHMGIEQDVFYPAVRDVDPDRVDASYEEHAMVELALKRLLGTDPSEMAFEAKLAVLAHLMDEHVAEEEEQLFPAVERALGEARLDELGQELHTTFAAARERGFAALMPPGPPALARTSADEAREQSARKP